MVLSKEHQEKLIKKEEEFVNELQKYKNISGKITMNINNNYSDYIDVYFDNGYLWFEIPRYRKTTLCSCLKINKDWYYEKGYGIPPQYTGGELDILAAKDQILRRLQSVKEEQNKMLESILD